MVHCSLVVNENISMAEIIDLNEEKRKRNPEPESKPESTNQHKGKRVVLDTGSLPLKNCTGTIDPEEDPPSVA